MSRAHRPAHPARKRAEPHRIIIAKGDDVRTFVLRKWMIGGGALLSLALTFWVCASTAYIVFRDDVLAAMMARQTRMQHNYEDRIASLRLQVDRVTSRQLLDQDAFNIRLDELLRRQQALDSRSQQVSSLMSTAKKNGIELNTADPITTGSLAPARQAASTDARAQRVEGMLGSVERDLSRIGAAQDKTVTVIEAKLKEREMRLRMSIAELGLTVEKLAGPRPALPVQDALGGPFVPLSAHNSDAFVLKTARLAQQMAWVDRIKKGMAPLPIRKPVKGDLDISSNFGGRSDPFYGSMAFHAGMDLRGDTGDPVYATGAGTVVSAGRQGGYGNMIEIDHGHSYTTRYGHLHQILVSEGAKVTPGQLIGRVGSTGRSTGPHLHYETRIDGEPADPMKFIRVGNRTGL